MHGLIPQDQFKKAVLAMTTAAVGSETAVMDIPALMAIAAYLRGAGRVSVRLVATIAGEIRMGALQLETGFLFMIKLPQIPGIGRVTTAAGLAQSPFMGVIGPVATDARAGRTDVLTFDMTALTGNDLMHANQRKGREIMVEAAHCAPVVGDMAGRADFHLGVLVDIISSVAASAIPREAVGQRTGMTAGAGRLLVRAGQRKSGLAGVVEFDLRPAFRAVAGIALFAVAPLVDVVTGVATAAGSRCLFRHYAVAVAGPARNLRMLVPQHEAGGVVVEYSLFPTVHAVAGIALLTILAGVDVRSLVTRDAGCFGKLVNLAGVATAAGDLAVQACEWKIRIPVIEFQPLLPALGLMAGVALLAERTPVEIILFVAVDALIAGLAIFLSGLMTRRTLLGFVLAFQLETGVSVIKRIDLHIDDVGVPTDVIRVTGVARLGAGQGIQAVEALPVLPVGPYFVVTVEAKGGQTGFVE